nr:hypothetical protein [uncultured Faecalimonas sp.]
MSTIALKNQNVYVNKKAEKKAEKKVSVWSKIEAFIMENADALEAYACSLDGRTYVPDHK